MTLNRTDLDDVKIKLRYTAEIEPVFGMLRGGLLIFPQTGGGLRTIATEACEIVDDRKSALWVTRNGEAAFAEFFEAYFSVNLESGAPRERFVAASYRELFRREFPGAELETPKYHGDGLVRCPHCGRIFRPLSFLGVVCCNDRSCLLDMNNPFYAPERIKESIEWGRLTHLAEYRGKYYCPKTQRYYPQPPSGATLLYEMFVERFREWRRRHRRRRGQEK